MVNGIASNANVPVTLEQVQELLAAQEAKFEEERQAFKKQIRQLQESLLKFKKQLFGSSSEKLQNLSSAQPPLFEDSLPELDENDGAQEEKEEYTEVSGYKKRKKRKKQELEGLPRERIEYLPEEKECEKCGKELVRIGEDIQEEIEYIPAQTIVREHASIKLGCNCCKQGVKAGKIPDEIRVLDRCKFGAGLLAKIIVNKYVDALPLYRQEEIFARGGFFTNRATLCRYVLRIALLLAPIAEALRAEILQGSAIHADETRLKRQTKEKKGLQQGYLWSVLGPPGVYFCYDDSRAAAKVKELLGEDFEGYVHCDHYVGYEPQHLPAGALRVACWAHARRKFVEAVTIQPKYRDAVLKRIAKIYKEEKKIKKLTSDKRLARRQEVLAPLFEDLEAYLRR